MATYRYAISKGVKVDVKDLPSDRSLLADDYTCIGCGGKLIAKTKDDKMEKHFAHSPGLDRPCRSESYLHKLGKLVFADEFAKCLQIGEAFTISVPNSKYCKKYCNVLGHSCYLGSQIHEFDLTEYYTSIEVEKSYENFIPDILLMSEDDKIPPLFIEIAVTHFASEEKKTSGFRTIEIPINAEGDVEKFKNHKLSDEDATFLNFHINPQYITDHDCECDKRPYLGFVVYESGLAYQFSGALRDIENAQSKIKGKYQWFNFSIVSSWHTDGSIERLDHGRYFMDNLRDAVRAGVDVKNCFLCKYSGSARGYSSNSNIFCKIDRQQYKSSQARECAKYKINRDEINFTGY